MESSTDDTGPEIRPDVEKVEEKPREEEEEAQPVRDLHGFKVLYLDDVQLILVGPCRNHNQLWNIPLRIRQYYCRRHSSRRRR